MLKNDVAAATNADSPTSELEFAETLSREAFEALGWAPAVRVTRGAILVELGRAAEGVTLLENTSTAGMSCRERAWTACALCLGHARLGNFASAVSH